jgi:hypothetical protein
VSTGSLCSRANAAIHQSFGGILLFTAFNSARGSGRTLKIEPPTSNFEVEVGEFFLL